MRSQRVLYIAMRVAIPGEHQVQPLQVSVRVPAFEFVAMEIVVRPLPFAEQQPVAMSARVRTRAQMRAQAAAVAIDVEVPDGLVIQGDGYLLRQALNNLLENALAFSSADSRLQLSAAREGGGVVLALQLAGSPDFSGSAYAVFKTAFGALVTVLLQPVMVFAVLEGRERA